MDAAGIMCYGCFMFIEELSFKECFPDMRFTAIDSCWYSDPMSIIICFKIATLLKTDVLHKLHTGGKKRKEEEKRTGRSVTWRNSGAPQPLGKFTTNWNGPIKPVLGFLLQKRLKKNCFCRRECSVLGKEKQVSCSQREDQVLAQLWSVLPWPCVLLLPLQTALLFLLRTPVEWNGA